jgi:hypothetical protein
MEHIAQGTWTAGASGLQQSNAWTLDHANANLAGSDLDLTKLHRKPPWHGKEKK